MDGVTYRWSRQSSLWHSFEQYKTALHAEHARNVCPFGGSLSQPLHAPFLLRKGLRLLLNMYGALAAGVGGAWSAVASSMVVVEIGFEGDVARRSAWLYTNWGSHQRGRGRRAEFIKVPLLVNYELLNLTNSNSSKSRKQT